MSPQVITGHPDQVHEIQEYVTIGQTPNTAKFYRAPTKSVQDICCGKILLPGKVGHSSC